MQVAPGDLDNVAENFWRIDMTVERQRSEAVKKAYDELASKRANWPNRHNIPAQTSKMLSDYTLLSRISMQGKKVLNVGCSEPVDEVFWVSIVEEWHALDVNEEVIKMAERMASEFLSPQLFEKLRFIVGDATNLDLEDGYYDVVVSFSTIDHIADHEGRQKAIGEMSRVLKRGGYLAITVPNRWDIIYSRRSRKMQRTGEAVFGYEYQFSPLELKKMIMASGLTITGCASRAYNPFSYYNRLLHKLKLEKLVIWFGARFGYLAQKP